MYLCKKLFMSNKYNVMLMKYRHDDEVQTSNIQYYLCLPLYINV